MQPANSKNFISMLGEEKPVMCFFHTKSEDVQVKKIKEILIKLKKSYPLLPLYEFIVDENKENKELCEHIEIGNKPMLVFYKNGCFSRYKDKNFTEPSIAQFIGSKAIYAIEENKSTKIEVDVE